MVEFYMFLLFFPTMKKNRKECMKRFWFPQYQKPILLLQNYLPMSKIIVKVGDNTPAQVDDWLVSYFYYWLPLISGMCSQGRGDGLLLLHTAITT